MADTVDRKELERLVKEVYGKVATEPHGHYHFETGRDVAEKLGYPPALLDRVPDQAVDSFAGVGYHFDLANMRQGESILDLGSGSGMDSFVAAMQVGDTGSVVGIDMTAEQLENARRLNVNTSGTIDFRDARIEELPFEDESFDVAVSNGVINLVEDKRKGFREISRVLKKGGRIAISNVVTEKQLDGEIVCDATPRASCIGGAMQQDNYRRAIEEAGMRIVEMRENPQYRFLSESAQEASAEYGVKSISLLAERI